MTAAFAIGQAAGPLVSGAIEQLPVSHHADALSLALWLAAMGLLGSAVALWRFARISRNERTMTLDQPHHNCVSDSARLWRRDG
jgi:hypothetical protein